VAKNQEWKGDLISKLKKLDLDGEKTIFINNITQELEELR